MNTTKPNPSHLPRTTELAHRLMDELGAAILGESLRTRGWTFGFDSGRRRLGRASWRRSVTGGLTARRITLSRSMVLLNGPDFVDRHGCRAVEGVVRHEIAHAIDAELRGTSDHGPCWKALAVRCGARPEATYDGDMASAQLRYGLECPHPGCTTQVEKSRVHEAVGIRCRAHRTSLMVTDRRTGLTAVADTGWRWPRLVLPPTPVRAAALTVRPATGTGIGARCEELILAGLSNDVVLATVRAEFPGARTKEASLNWYRSKLRKEGRLA